MGLFGGILPIICSTQRGLRVHQRQKFPEKRFVLLSPKAGGVSAD